MGQFNSNDIEGDVDWRDDLRGAMWWKVTTETLAEWALEDLPPSHPDRRGLTALLSSIRQGDVALVDEYREWQRREPKITAGMAYAGRLHHARIRRRLARWLVRG